ncbi:MAG: chemotaxis protein CheA, partial [Rhodobacterales bacterium]
LRGCVSREAIEDVFMFIRDDMELELAPLDQQVKGAEEAVDPAAQKTLALAPAEQLAKSDNRTAAGGGSSLRVPAERLDDLMDRVGELVIAQERLNQLAHASDDVNLKAVAEEMGRLSAGLRDTTMGIRMVQIGTLFGRFRRLVHDLSSELGKDIDFVTIGEDTELDKTMIEQLADPLVHLIRNAVDHGLESAEARREAGKPARGTVRLSAFYTGAEVAISVSDDGAGLDPARIRAKAEESGLLAPDAPIDENALLRMIFHPGFSTAKEITSLSGRGVGMDVVKRTIDGLRGAIDVSTVKGEGSTITLRLPLTLAIVDGMLIRVGKERYSIPLAAVEECVELPAAVAHGSKNRSFLNIRGSLVPYLRLRDLFGVEGPPDTHPKVVIVSSGDIRVGLVVDQILGNTQTVIKQLSKLHSEVKTFSGATILGDGTIALILDIMNLVDFGQTIDARETKLGRAA